MIVYSKKIIQFVNDIKCAVKGILTKEVRLKVEGNRFCNQRQSASYPIKVVIFNNKSMLGYFDSNFFELGFHECLMLSSREQLQNVIRHELAHYITFINYRGFIQSHGSEFMETCKQLGWGESVFRASVCLDGGQNTTEIEESGVLRRVKKLMALASSSNQNEAELAMIKSQQLLLNHNIESKYIAGDEGERVFLKRIMKQKRENAKMRSIASILETFFVSTVYSRSEDFIYLEIMGSAVNIEIAEYVAIVLQTELDSLWNQAQKQANLKGMVAKNSFFIGIAIGYCNKIQALKRDYNSDVRRGLMIIEKNLIDAKAMVYPRLISSRSSGSYCQESSALGEKMGRQLNINPAINKSSNTSGIFIGYKESLAKSR